MDLEVEAATVTCSATPRLPSSPGALPCTN